MTWLLRILLEPRILAALLVAGSLALGFLHYRGLRSDLADAQAALASAQTELAQAVDIAKGNAIALATAEADHRNAVAALEAANASMALVTAQAREDERAVLSAPDSEDGPVAPLLEALRTRRFSGGRS